MLFTDATYLLFFASVFSLYWLARRGMHRKLVLLAASYLFYSAWDWRFLSLILVSTIVDYFAARGIAAAPSLLGRRAWLAFSLTVNLGILAVFKYLNFFIDSAIETLAWLGTSVPDPALSIVLPIGISFYTFQTLSYSIDVYRGRLQPVDSPLDLALFVAFFPQLVAGPIVRASTFLPQLQQKHRFADVDWRGCLILFFSGYVKKACLADNLALVVDPVFANPTAYDWGSVCLAAVGFSVQIYGDFAGYSDMAIASAGFLGFVLPKNFDFPFVSRSPAEFWRRWHISLSSWLRDYLYISLGGNRAGAGRTYANLMVTMLLGGLWHGAAWTFVVWGALHGTALVVHRAAAPRLGRFVRGLGVPLTLAIVVGCFVIFRAPTLAQGVAMLRIASLTGEAGETALQTVWWGLIGAFALMHVAGAAGVTRRVALEAPRWLFAVAYGVGWALALAFTAYAPAPFIYFQF